MCDQWMPSIHLPLSPEQFRRLPRNSAYRYEYIDGQLYLSPRPKHYHALLELTPPQAETKAEPLRQVKAEDFPALEVLFAQVFRTIQPFGSLDDDTLGAAVHKSLEQTRNGGDGPLIEAASFVAEEEGKFIGAALITLLPEGDPCDWESYRWKVPPPPDCIERRIGRPHLTWIFVSPWIAGHGLGSELLAKVSGTLWDMGFRQLLSTFILGNDSSMLWHWRNGFRLLMYPGSYRRRPSSPAS